MVQWILTYWWVAGFSVIVAAYFIRLQVGVWYTYAGGIHEAGVVLSVLRGRLSVRRMLTHRPQDRGESTPICELRSFLRAFMGRAAIVVALLPRPVRIESLRLRVTLGTGETALTGMSVGAAYALIYSILAPLNAYATYAERPEITVVPDFSRACLSGRLDCILAHRLGDIMSVILRVLYKRIVKGVATKWKSIPSRV